MDVFIFSAVVHACSRRLCLVCWTFTGRGDRCANWTRCRGQSVVSHWSVRSLSTVRPTSLVKCLRLLCIMYMVDCSQPLWRWPPCVYRRYIPSTQHCVNVRRWTEGYRLQTKPPYDKNPLVRLIKPVQSKLPSFYCQYGERKRQINSSRCILFTLRRTKKSWCIYYNLMKTLNTSSGDYTAVFHSPSAYDAQSDRLWHLSV